MVSSIGDDADSPPNCFDRLEGFVSETASLCAWILYETDGGFMCLGSGLGFVAGTEDSGIKTIT
jgi:hypothetical protein